MVNKTAPIKKICSKCKSEKKLEEYYLASSNLINADGKLSICKDCLEFLVVDFNNPHNVFDVMRMIDRPFLKQEYDGALVGEKKPFREYMRRLAMRQNRDLSFADSITDDLDVKIVKKSNLNSVDTVNIDEDIELTQQELKELIQFFGKGFKTEDYLWLQNEYIEFLNRYECDSKGMELLIKEICLQQLDIQNRRAAGEKVDQQLKTLQDLLGSSNLKPVQETGANAVEQESFGTLIKKFENERPIPEPDERWKDVDGIGKYLKVWFLGHLARMVGLENPYQKEYDEEVNKYKIELDENEEEDDEDGIL